MPREIPVEAVLFNVQSIITNMENHYYCITSFRALIQRDNNEISCEISVINLHANCVWGVVCTFAGSGSSSVSNLQKISFAGSWHWRVLCFRLYFEKKKTWSMLTKQPLIWFDSSSMDECNHRGPPMHRTFYHRFVRHPAYMTTVNMQISVLPWFRAIYVMHIILINVFIIEKRKLELLFFRCKTIGKFERS